MLVAAVTAELATIAGADQLVAAQLGIAMLGIQFGIGTVNDLADAPHDATAKPGKAIPAGLVSPGAARLVAAGSLGGGFLLAALRGPVTLVVAALGAGSGLAYDLRLKGTVLSWAPFVVAVPLVPAFAWLGVTGALPGPILVAVVLAAPVGGALALANALPDIELDSATGVASAAVALGRRRAWAIGAALQAVVALVAVVEFRALAGRTDLWPAVLGSLALLGTGVLIGSGASVIRRQRGWEIQALAIGLLGAAWILAVAGPA